MAVGDEQLRVADLLGEGVAELCVESPEAVAAALQLGVAQPVDLDRAVPEEEEGLELRPRSLEEAQATLLRARVRALVRENDPVRVRLDLERRDEALPPSLDSVGSDVLLREPPERRLLLLDEHASLPPVRKLLGRILLGLGQGQVDHVVRATR